MKKLIYISLLLTSANTFAASFNGYEAASQYMAMQGVEAVKNDTPEALVKRGKDVTCLFYSKNPDGSARDKYDDKNYLCILNFTFDSDGRILHFDR